MMNNNPTPQAEIMEKVKWLKKWAESPDSNCIRFELDIAEFCLWQQATIERQRTCLEFYVEKAEVEGTGGNIARAGLEPIPFPLSDD